MKEIIQLKNYMAEPVTPLEQLQNNQDDMKTQMELLIMRIQAEFCRALEKEEDEVNMLMCKIFKDIILYTLSDVQSSFNLCVKNNKNIY